MKSFCIFIVVFLVLGICSVTAQDLIILKDGSIIEAKVTELSPTEIRYKRFDHLDGPNIVIPKSNVLSIRYENGRVENINAAPTAVQKNTQMESHNDRNQQKKQEYAEVFSNRYFFIGGSASYQGHTYGHTYDRNSDINSSDLVLSPILGWNFNRFGFGINPWYQCTDGYESYYSNNQYHFYTYERITSGIGIFAQFNFFTIDRFSMLGRVHLNYSTSSYEGGDTFGYISNDLSFSISPIFEYRLLDKLSIFTSIGLISYKFMMGGADANGEDAKVFRFNIGLSDITFGFNILFPFKPKKSDSDSINAEETDNKALQPSTTQKSEKTNSNLRFNTIGGTVGYLGVPSYGFSLNGTVSPANYTFFDFNIGLGFSNLSYNGHINFCGFAPFNNGGWYGGLGLGGGAYEFIDSMNGYFAVNVITGFIFFNWLNISATLQIEVVPEINFRFKPMVGYVYRFKPQQ